MISMWDFLEWIEEQQQPCVERPNEIEFILTYLIIYPSKNLNIYVVGPLDKKFNMLAKIFIM